jgi:signal transduction histidine kinase
MINNAGQRIMRTIDEILEMSQIQTGSYEFHQEDVDLENDVLKTITYEYSLLAKTKKLAFKYENNSDNKSIFADKFMVNQIFTNLIDNSIKFTNEGSIEVIQYNGENGRMCVDVKDTGIGISQEYMPRLYAPFSQEDSGYTRKFEGNGLGLAIVKKYIEFNKAEISVISKKGEGTTFTVKF